MTATALPSTRVPREWLAAITSPTRGVLDAAPNAWSRSPANIERVLVREVIPGDLAPAPTNERDQAGDAATAVETTLTDLARELGAFYSDLIPHNCGLFLPGTARAMPDARTTIKALFEHVRAGGMVNRPAPAVDGQDAPAVKRKVTAPADEPVLDERQIGLF